MRIPLEDGRRQQLIYHGLGEAHGQDSRLRNKLFFLFLHHFSSCAWRAMSSRMSCFKYA